MASWLRIPVIQRTPELRFRALLTEDGDQKSATGQAPTIGGGANFALKCGDALALRYTVRVAARS